MKYEDIKPGDIVRIRYYSDETMDNHKNNTDYLEIIAVWRYGKLNKGFSDLVAITPNANLYNDWIPHKDDKIEILEYFGNTNPMNFIPEHYKI